MRTSHRRRARAGGPSGNPVGIERKLYDFVWLRSEAEAIIAGSVAAAVTRDLRILVELDRTLDPLRDAEYRSSQGATLRVCA